MEAIRRLQPEQLWHFDQVYISEQDWRFLDCWLEKTGATAEPFCFLDIGGGNGQFIDELLKRYPQPEGVVLDVSRELLALNHPNPASNSSVAALTIWP
jgi:ubiquinone/menaquinone biosynthesis C-methylase UbiE